MWVTGYLKILASYLFLLQVVNLQCFCSPSFVSKAALRQRRIRIGYDPEYSNWIQTCTDRTS